MAGIMTAKTCTPATPGTVKGPAYTRVAQRIRRRYAASLELLAPGLPSAQSMGLAYAALRQQAPDVADALRMLRQIVLERLLTLDCTGDCPLEAVTLAMTELAEFTLEQAFTESQRVLQAQHGEPLGPDGQPATMCIVGMGKLGARELNVSSDIDLIYIFDHDGETRGDASGRGHISNQEFFAKQVRAIYALIGDTTAHGFVFRVDLALRPNGNSGPPAVSIAALEEYFQLQGREWERFAWLKSRIVAPRAATSSALAQSLRAVTVPFVFRRYLDYNVFDALRVLHRQIREHAARRSAGHPERSNDVKLSRGGIREIEFTVQLLQVVRGGQYPELRTRPTVSALDRMAQAGLMPAENAQALRAAYRFLRRVEHCIQYLDDQQTHTLPTQDADLHWIAETLGFADTCQFLAELDQHRELVAQEFDALLGGTTECKGCNGKRPGDAASEWASAMQGSAGALHARLTAWQNHPRVLALREVSRARLARLIARTVRWVNQGNATPEAALSLLDWVETLLRRESYLALLLERPNIHERVLRLLGTAKWPARYLQQHPGVIDELASAEMLHERFDANAFEAELETRRQALQDNQEDDEETLLNLLRRAHHAEVFRTLARDLEGHLSVEQVADDLSALAASILRITIRWVWQRLKNKHRPTPRIGVIAYGKLGGLELGYGSDLDLVFVFDDTGNSSADEDLAAETYASLVRKTIHWLTVKTGEGDLYEIDTALRPNGNSGLLITRFAAYAAYQENRGSNTAWTWEHQAMTRARWVLGDADLAERFNAVRETVIRSPRDRNGLRHEISDMRAKVRSAHPVRGGGFDVKHSPGGMVDIEFAVQFLVLSESDKHVALRENAGNIALLLRAEACGLLPAGMGAAAAQAYRSLRHLQHVARLNEAPTQVPAEQVHAERAAGLALWQHIFQRD